MTRRPTERPVSASRASTNVPALPWLVTFNRPPPHAQMSGLKAIYGRDPDGNIIEIQETLDNTYGISMSGLALVRRHRSDSATEQSDLEEIRKRLNLY